MIRVIAGSAKGRRLKGPKEREFRPTTGRVKEFIYSYLGPDIENSTILDLFSGSGSLGIEALSRGASHVTFIERDRIHGRIIEQNIQVCGFQNQARLIIGDVFQSIQKLFESKRHFDFVLADPPFRSSLHGRILDTISRYPLLGEKAELLIEHEQHDSAIVPENINLLRVRQFGNCHISIYEMQS